ncbi:MAG: glycosyltransferase family 4 protein [Patescibacteria group bacterium]
MSRDKKILYLITKSVWGGAGKYVYDLALAAKENGHDVTVAAGGHGMLADRLERARIPFISLGELKREMGLLGSLRIFFNTLKLFLSVKPHIVHANSPQAAGIGGVALFLYRVLAWRPGLQAIYTAHGWSYHEARPKWQTFLIKLFSKITCLFYQKIICVSEYDRQSALKLKIAPSHKLLTIHNGVDENEIKFMPREEARRRLNLSKTEFLTVGTVGEFTKNKGQAYFVGALKTLKDRDIKFQGLIIGWGELKQNLESRIQNLELKEKISLIDSLSTASSYLKAFDIFVLPSIKEGLPYTLLEAGLAGLPVIAASVGGVPEIIENEKTGLLVEPANASELAKAILRLIQDENLRKTLGENLRQKVLKNFSKKEMLEKTFALYE